MLSDLRNSQSGFTLLELLIAIVILAFISMAIFQATTKSFELRDVLLVEGDFYNEIRLSMNVVEQDLTLIYSPKIMAPPAPNSQTGGSNASGNPSNNQPPVEPARPEDPVTSEFWRGTLDATGIRHSRFLGDEKSIKFISSSNKRIYRDSQQSVFAKISYETQADEKAEDEMENTQILVRTINTNAFDLEKDEDDFTRSYPLLRGIKELKLQYYSKSKDEWYKAWDTDLEEFKNTFPDIIEIQIQVVGPQRHQFSGRYRFRPEVPHEGLQPSS